MSEPERDGDEDAFRDDFLFHLSRGAELLRDARVHESKEELERALRVRPSDPAGQDMLAQVYYRLGVYPRAVGLYEDLLAQHPGSAALHVNLALVYLKTGQPLEAQGHLLEATRLEPEHTRAWGYLGLVQARLGRYVEAREAFLRSGHAAMAQRMDQMLANGSAGSSDVVPRGAGRGEELAPAHAAVEGAFDTLGPPEPFAPVVPEGVAPPVRSPPSRPSIRAIAPAFLTHELPPLGEWLARVGIVFPPAGGLLVDADGDVLAQLPDPHVAGEGHGLLAARVSVLRVEIGGVHGGPVSLDPRTVGIDGPLGGHSDPLVVVHGPGQLVLRAARSHRLTALRLSSESVFVREPVLAALGGGVHHESGAIEIPGLRERYVVVHVLGPGFLVLQTARAPRSVPLTSGVVMRLAPDAVVGWSGRVFPTRSEGSGPWLSLAGEGAVIVQ